MRSGTLLASLLVAATGFAQEWQIDNAHSAAQFSVRHLMVSTVRGQFDKMTGTVNFDPANPSAASVTAEVDVNSINTRQPKRDAHLKSADFFDAGKYPKITFRSTKVEKVGDGVFKVTGDFTMHGVTRPVVFDVEGLNNVLKDQRGERMGAVATAKINRSDFGITWNRALEAGGVTVSDEVNIILDVELVRRTPSSN